jgi:hypothetical protein
LIETDTALILMRKDVINNLGPTVQIAAVIDHEDNMGEAIGTIDSRMDAFSGGRHAPCGLA